MLIQIKNTKVAALPYLYMLMLRYIYEKDKMSVQEIRLMQESVVSWAKKLDISEDEKRILEYIAYRLYREEKGKYAERKENFKRHGINWRKYERLSTEKYGIGTIKAN